MKNKKTVIINITAILLFGGFSFYVFQQLKAETTTLIKTTVQAEVIKKIPKTEVEVIKNTQDSEKDIAFQHKIDSLNLAFKILANIPKSVSQDKQQQEQDKQRNAILLITAVKAQIKADSLENVIKELTSMVKTNFIVTQANQAQSKQVVLESPKTVKPFYENVSMIFRTRQSFISAKVDQNFFSNFQYGQVFHFDNSIPEYMTAFSDNKGGSISNEAAKNFLQGKAFYVNSIDLKNHNAVVKCFQN